MRTPLFACGALVVALLGCRSNNSASKDDPREPPTLTSATARGPESPSVKERMRGHDAHGAAMRDAVARGDLEGAKREAKVLADFRLEGAIEPTWRKDLDAMNAAAARVAQASDLHAASVGVGAVARTCGNCHATLGGPAPAVGEPPQGSGVAFHMQRHQWAAARLWDGLEVPSNDAWLAGARVLSDAPLEPEVLTPGKSPVPTVGVLARRVHDLANKAKVADSAVDRGAIYGEVLSTCSDCHQRLGGGPPPPAKRDGGHP